MSAIDYDLHGMIRPLYDAEPPVLETADCGLDGGADGAARAAEALPYLTAPRPSTFTHAET